MGVATKLIRSQISALLFLFLAIPIGSKKQNQKKTKSITNKNKTLESSILMPDQNYLGPAHRTIFNLNVQPSPASAGLFHMETLDAYHP